MKGYLKNMAFCLIIAFMSCNQGSNKSLNENSIAAAEADSTSPLISSSPPMETGKEPERKFIRTADLKFKVKNVVQTTYQIEDITSRQEGFVIYSNLASNTDNVTTTTLSPDSSLETTFYTVTNSITLRVPNSKLDTTIKEISHQIDYLDYRVIRAEDVALQLLANSQAENRNANSGARLVNAIEKRGKKLNETVDAEEILLEGKSQSDNARISNLSLMDKVKFSTINIILYQRQLVNRELVSSYKNIAEYEPSFGRKFEEAIAHGWKAFETFIIFFTNFWSLIVLGAVVYFAYRVIKSKM